MRSAKRWAKKIVANRPMDSCAMDNNVAVVADVVVSVEPRPMPWSTAREARREAIVLAKACKES